MLIEVRTWSLPTFSKPNPMALLHVRQEMDVENRELLDGSMWEKPSWVKKVNTNSRNKSNKFTSKQKYHPQFGKITSFQLTNLWIMKRLFYESENARRDSHTWEMAAGRSFPDGDWNQYCGENGILNERERKLLLTKFSNSEFLIRDTWIILEKFHRFQLHWKLFITIWDILAEYWWYQTKSQDLAEYLINKMLLNIRYN